jgi:transposase
MNIRYRVELSQAERSKLAALLNGGKHSARKLKRAQILLAADAGASDEDIAISVGVGGSTVYRTKRRFLVGNLEEALNEEPRPGASRKLSGKEEALLVATACSNPPEGRARWTLELLADELVRLTEHDSISRETVRRRLTENDLKPWRKDMWCIPHIDGEYNTSLEWRMCSTYMRKCLIRSARLSVSTRARPSSSVRYGSRSRPCRGNRSAMTASIDATGRSICSFSSMPTDPGAR